MNHQLRRLTSKRVADFFVTVNAGDDFTQVKDKDNIHFNKNTNSNNNDNSNSISLKDLKNYTFMASVAERYPVTDRLNQPLPEGIPLFCFPTGVQLIEYMKPPTFHTFVHTSEGGSRLLGCCLTFYKLLNNEQKESIRQLISPSSSSAAIENSSNTSIPNDTSSAAINKKTSNKINDINLNSLYAPYCLCLISHWTFVSSFKKFMCNLYQLSLQPCNFPIERYICNFIDDVPAPPAGRIDVTYYLNDQAITFRCPPPNEPNVWSGMPLSSLFECLSPENILTLFSMVLIERQVVFISSQYSLLTLCAEAITSLLYPLTWTHAYIPILPKKLLGVLAAPFPFILGIHSSYIEHDDRCICEDTVRVYLDDNYIDAGSNGQLPPLPDRQARKLLQEIVAVGKLFEYRGDSWKDDRCPHFDSAFSSTSNRPASRAFKITQQSGNENSSSGVINSNTVGYGNGNGSNNSNSGNSGNNNNNNSSGNNTNNSNSSGNDNLIASNNKIDASLRSAFLKFFVGLLKNYRRHLIYGNAQDPNPMVKFQFDAFLLEHAAEWRPFLKEMLNTQQFSEFIDSRILEVDRDPDVVFFDESIDAKMNRYTFKFQILDTPFLNNSDLSKHQKTYVAPSPDVNNLPPMPNDGAYVYKDGCSKLNPSLFSPPRNLTPPLNSGPAATSSHLAKLKRINPHPLLNNSDSTILSATACTYISYIVTICRLVCYTQSHLYDFKSTPRPTVQQLIEEYGYGYETDSNNGMNSSFHADYNDGTVTTGTSSHHIIRDSSSSSGGGGGNNNMLSSVHSHHNNDDGHNNNSSTHILSTHTIANGGSSTGMTASMNASGTVSQCQSHKTAGSNFKADLESNLNERLRSVTITDQVLPLPYNDEEEEEAEYNDDDDSENNDKNNRHLIEDDDNDEEEDEALTLLRQSYSENLSDINKDESIDNNDIDGDRTNKSNDNIKVTATNNSSKSSPRPLSTPVKSNSGVISAIDTSSSGSSGDKRRVRSMPSSPRNMMTLVIGVETEVNNGTTTNTTSNSNRHSFNSRERSGTNTSGNSAGSTSHHTNNTTATNTTANTAVSKNPPAILARANTIARWRNGTDGTGSNNQSLTGSSSSAVAPVTVIEEKDLLEAAKLALKVAFEALNSLSRLDEPADDAAYRSLAEACGCCGFAQQVIDLVVHMGDEGLLPDNQMLSSVARAIATFNAEHMSRHNSTSVNGSTNNSPSNSNFNLNRQASLPSPHSSSNNNKSSNNYQQQQRSQFTHSQSLSKSSSSSSSVVAAITDPHHAVSGAVEISPSEVWTLQYWQWENIHKGKLYRRKLYGYANGDFHPGMSNNSNNGGLIVNGNTTNANNNGNGMANNDAVIEARNKSRRDMMNSSSTSSYNNSSRQSLSSSSSSSAATGRQSESVADGLVNLLFGGSDNNAMSSRGYNNSNSGNFTPPPVRRVQSSYTTTPTSITANTTDTTTTTNNNNLTTPPLLTSFSSSTFTPSPQQMFPTLQWSWKIGETVNSNNIYSASKRLSRHMAVAEELLVKLFPGLTIDLQLPLGMSCPGHSGRPCPLKRPLTLDEIFQGWDLGNANKYTTTCKICRREFVPRFTVHCLSKSWIGSEGPKSVLWCELLSPWTLKKELFNILFEEGVEHLIAPSFRHPSLSTQHAVLFWNILIAFRLQGLPYAFLLCGESITSAFPPPPLKTSISTASVSTTAA